MGEAMTELAEAAKALLEFDPKSAVNAEEEARKGGTMPGKDYVPDFADGAIYESERVAPLAKLVPEMIDLLEDYQRIQSHEWMDWRDSLLEKIRAAVRSG
jgi:hypothetical protein